MKSRIRMFLVASVAALGLSACATDGLLVSGGVYGGSGSVYHGSRYYDPYYPYGSSYYRSPTRVIVVPDRNHRHPHNRDWNRDRPRHHDRPRVDRPRNDRPRNDRLRPDRPRLDRPRVNPRNPVPAIRDRQQQSRLKDPRIRREP